MRRSLLAVFAVAAAVVVATAAWRSLRPPRSREPGPERGATIGMDTPLGDTEVTTDMGRLVADYLADERAANERYLFKTVAVSGVLLEVEHPEPRLTTVVVVKQVGSKEMPCTCQGGPALAEAVAKLAPGQPVTVRGKAVGQQQMRMVLLNCELVR